MDGMELAGRIRSAPGLAGTALLLMSSDGTTAQTAAGSPGGCFDACLPKPLRQSELYDALAAAMGSAPADIATASRPAVDKAGPSAGDGRTGLRILLAEDHPVNQKLAARILEGS